MKKVLILGGKGTAEVIADSIIDANNLGNNECAFSGFVNDHHTEIAGHPVLGTFSDIPKLIEQGYYFINTVYKIGGQDERIDLFENLNIPDENLCTFIHPHAYVSPSVKLGAGCVVLANAAISPNTTIGRCSLILNNVNIGHDNVIGQYTKFTANSCIGGDLVIEDGAWFGLNCTIRGKLKIGKNAVIGIGAVLTKNVKDNEVWVGNPAKFHKTNSDKMAI